MGLSATVVKVGGSLYDLPDLGCRLGAWLETVRQPILVPGGGTTADVIREFDHRHGLGDEASHWLALRALTLNAHCLALLLPRAEVITDLLGLPMLWERGVLPILDAHAFARADEGRPGHLPHRWDVTSDSVAARIAQVATAAELCLLKSIDLPLGVSWPAAAELGLVDRYFPRVVAGESGRLRVRVVNLRTWLWELAESGSEPAPQPARDR